MWTPKASEATQMELFCCWVNQRYSLNLDNYNDLYSWSTKALGLFLASVWEYTKLISSQGWQGEVVDENAKISDLPNWFEGARLNFAENLLWCWSFEKVAIYATGEHASITSQRIQQITYSELYKQVETVAGALRASGVQAGDRVVGYLPNCPEAIVAMLASASLGTIWSSTSPDFGVHGVLDRFGQIEPKILFSVNAIVYNGKVHSRLDKLRAVAEGLRSLRRIVVLRFIQNHPTDLSFSPLALDYDAFVLSSDGLPLTFVQLPFNHPLYILFSSGTTGPPKCLVHTAGGILIQHKKEHVIHGNLGPSDVVFQYTTIAAVRWASNDLDWVDDVELVGTRFIGGSLNCAV